jgi:hypothetical protein
VKNGKFLTLAAKISADLADLERVVERAELIFNKAIQTDDDAYLDGLALNIHGFYGGVEHILEAIARTVDGSVPDDPNWHQSLLRQMAVEIPTIRPPVLAQETYQCLEVYRSFRHLVRNVYTFNLRGSRLKELATDLRPCLTAVTHDLTQFTQLLYQLSQDD